MLQWAGSGVIVSGRSGVRNSEMGRKGSTRSQMMLKLISKGTAISASMMPHSQLNKMIDMRIATVLSNDCRPSTNGTTKFCAININTR